jgi:ribosomal protein S16
MVEAIAVEIDDDGPVVATAMFESLGPKEEQAYVIERLVAADDPRASEVLEAIGRYHPSKPVAKAARKAAFKRRTSRGA